MQVYEIFELLAAAAGLAVATLLFIFPRFGPPSRLVAVVVLSGALCAAVVGGAPMLKWAADSGLLLAFVLLLACGTLGWIAAYGVERADFPRQWKKHRWFFLVIPSLAPV